MLKLMFLLFIAEEKFKQYFTILLKLCEGDKCGIKLLVGFLKFPLRRSKSVLTFIFGYQSVQPMEHHKSGQRVLRVSRGVWELAPPENFENWKP